MLACVCVLLCHEIRLVKVESTAVFVGRFRITVMIRCLVKLISSFVKGTLFLFQFFLSFFTIGLKLVLIIIFRDKGHCERS